MKSYPRLKCHTSVFFDTLVLKLKQKTFRNVDPFLCGVIITGDTKDYFIAQRCGTHWSATLSLGHTQECNNGSEFENDNIFDHNVMTSYMTGINDLCVITR